MGETIHHYQGDVRSYLNTCTRFGLRTSNEAAALSEVEARGPSKVTQFSTVKASASMVCDISPTFTSGKLPRAKNEKSSEFEVYLHRSQ
jgi:hypothetical protein